MDVELNLAAAFEDLFGKPWRFQARYPRQRPGDLGPNQLAWLRKNIPAFNIAKEAADKVRAEMDANRKSMA